MIIHAILVLFTVLGCCAKEPEKDTDKQKDWYNTVKIASLALLPIVLIVVVGLTVKCCTSKNDPECCGCLDCCIDDVEGCCEKCFHMYIPCCCTINDEDFCCKCLCNCHKEYTNDCCYWCEIPICWDFYVCWEDHCCCDCD